MTTDLAVPEPRSDAGSDPAVLPTGDFGCWRFYALR